MGERSTSGTSVDWPPRRCIGATFVAAIAVVAASVSGCAGDASGDRIPPPAMVILQSLTPATILPKTAVQVTGNNLLSSVNHQLRLTGSIAGRSVEQVVALVVEERVGQWVVDEASFAAIGEGQLVGSAQVISRNATGDSTTGPMLPVNLRFARHLTPRLNDAGAGIVHLNSAVRIEGDELLLGSGEGQSVIEIEGCFLPGAASGPCTAGSQRVEARLPVNASAEGERRRGEFLFAPTIAGIRPGHLDGTLQVVNEHPDGRRIASGKIMARFDLLGPRLTGLDQPAVSLGQYLDFNGLGFAGSAGASTTIRFEGTFTNAAGKERSFAADLVPEVASGQLLRYVLEEGTGIGSSVALREEQGVLRGSWTPTVRFGGVTIDGERLVLGLNILPVKQVCWVRFTGGWSDSLRHFGLAAADEAIRKRILDVLARDYTGINVDFRLTEPRDFKLYAILDISGKDPNGMGLLGYDNTPGKDVDNERLHDRIGGVSAQTQEDGYPGFGGIFADSVLGFSTHPPPGIQKSPLASPSFDQIFDPFRPDRGAALSSAEALAMPALEAVPCPASDRISRAACAVRVLGNLVGTTTSHELGHSLGLAEPYGSENTFHNPGDGANRLMDSGADRPFAERAELAGEGPAMFCEDEFLYLRRLLPGSAASPPAQRPSCY